MRGKKDILFLLQFFYPEYVSSATLPYDTATELVSEGFQVDALCGYPHEYTEKVNVPCKENVNGINVKRVRYLQLSRKKAIGRIVNYLSFTIAMFLRFFSMRKYKTIMVYSNPPILPLVAEMHGKKIHLTRLFDWALYVARLFSGLVDKAFGSFVYELEDVENYVRMSNIVDFSESIRRTEK